MQINQIDQAKYILTALHGNFQAFQWRNHGGYDLDDQYIWWTSQNALPAWAAGAELRPHQGPGHRRDLAANRGETDPAKKQQYAEAVNKLFGEQCYNLWGSWTVWGLPHAPNVMDVGVFTNPDGTQQSPGTGGYLNVRSLWVNPNA